MPHHEAQAPPRVRDIASASEGVPVQGTAIYCLIDPRDESIFYVGKTSQTLKTRLYAHCTDDTPGPKKRKIDHIRDAGAVPEIRILENGLDRIAWGKRERHWIEAAKNDGEELTNTATGGGGASKGKRRKRKVEVTTPERPRGTDWENHLLDFLDA